MSFRIQIGQEQFPCSKGSSVLQAMTASGKKNIPIGCRAGGCGVCKIKVCCGEFTSKAMSRARVTAEDELLGYALACRVFPKTDLVIELAPEC